jgi:hypothetical protein
MPDDTIDLLAQPGTIIVPAPLSCDLTADPLACAILHAWARQPWQEAHRAALVDRMEEQGRTAEEQAWARAWGQGDWWGTLVLPRWATYNRESRRNATRILHRELTEQFGDFERILYESGTEDTPSGG